MLDAVSSATNNSSPNLRTNDAGDGGRGNAGKCLILFPTEDATTFDMIKKDMLAKMKEHSTVATDDQTTYSDRGWDIVVIDGTWGQARKMHAKYLQESQGGCLYRVQLSNEAVEILDGSPDRNSDGSETSGNVATGHQLRRHPIKWREISTFEATRLLLNDMHTDGKFEEQSKAMTYYQQIGNDAAKRQLGPPRVRQP